MNESNMRKGLGSVEARALSNLAAQGKNIFTISELAAQVGSKEYARFLAWSLVKKKWVERIGRGVYLALDLAAGSRPEWTEDSYYIASKLASPYYIGFYNMLNHYGWTEQVPLGVAVAVTKPLKPREIHGVRYNFVCLSKKKFFGTLNKTVNGHEIIASDPEKTLVDALDHPEYCGGVEEVAKALFNASAAINWLKLVGYAKKQGNGAVFKRLGYLCELMEITLPLGLKDKIKRKITKGYSPLYPGAGPKGKHDAKWNLVLNAKITKQSVLA